MEQPNLKYIENLSGNDDEFKQEIIAILKKELPLEIDAYQQKLKALKYVEAALLVHKIKHKISILGLEKSYYIAGEFEFNLKNNQMELKQDFENILVSMQTFVDKL